MREILFRGKRVDNGEWAEGYLFAFGAYAFIVNQKEFIAFESSASFPSVCELGTFGSRVIPETVGQYTGLTDKNRVRIFEGDVLDENRYLFAVEYDQKWAKFKLQHCKKAIQYPEWNRGILMEIVGNIHDNPELLKGED